MDRTVLLWSRRAMKYTKPTLVLLFAFVIAGLSGCDGRDRGHDREHVDVTEHVDVREHVDEHPAPPPRDQRPCDRDHDPHCDDRPR